LLGDLDNHRANLPDIPGAISDGKADVQSPVARTGSGRQNRVPNLKVFYFAVRENAMVTRLGDFFGQLSEHFPRGKTEVRFSWNAVNGGETAVDCLVA
jgi:hypothetical protein